MEIIIPPTKKLMTRFERHEPAVRDPTAMKDAKTCKRKYFLRIVLGFNEPGVNYPITFGVAYHKFREILERTGELKPAFDAAMKAWPGDPAVGTRWEFLTRERLAKSLMVAYAERNHQQERGIIKVIGTEQAFDLIMADGKTRRGGRIDQTVLWTGKPAVRDFKSSSKTDDYWQRLLEPNDQFSTYAWAFNKLSGRDGIGVLVEVLYNTKKEGPKIKPFVATRTAKQLERWEADQIFYERSILDACREADVWPMEESQCIYCPFRAVCSKSSEGAMMAHLEQYYVQKAWDFKKTDEGEENAS